MAIDPERATLHDFDAIVAIADQCFPHEKEKGGMLVRWPHCYLRDARSIHNFLLIREDSKPVSIVEYVDHRVRIGEGRIRVGGLTAVATLPSHRHRGFMTRLLHRCIEHMRKEGYALSELGGYRLRYNRLGWESAGLEWRFRIDRGCLHAKPGDDSYRVVPYGQRPEELDDVISIHSKERVGLERSPELTALLLRRGGWDTWLAEAPSGITAYAVCYVGDDGERSIGEFGGDPEGIHAILCHLVDDLNTPSLSVTCPRIHPLNDYFASVSWGWDLGIPRMIKIIDLERTLRAFSAQLLIHCQRMELRAERSVVLGAKETGQQVQVNLSRDQVSVSRAGERTPTVHLPERSMVRYLFCPRMADPPPDWPLDVCFFDRLLPLDFFVWPLERV